MPLFANSTSIAVLFTPSPYATTSGQSWCGRSGSMTNSGVGGKEKPERRLNFATVRSVLGRELQTASIEASLSFLS